MSAIPANTLFVWINVISLSALGIAAAATIALYQLSAKMNAEKDRQLQQVQSEARVRIEAAKADATEAIARAAGLVKANAELQLELQTEKDARTTMREQQSQPRDMTKEQFATFVQTIKGKVPRLSLFTVSDPEASVFGVTVLDALQKADVSVSWYRIPSSMPLMPGIASTGVTIYEYAPGGDERTGRTLLKAFTDINMQSSLLLPPQPLQGVPSPSLIIAFKPLEFLRPSNHPIPAGTRKVPPDLFSRAE